MSQSKSLVLACLALSALPLLAGCGQSGGDPANAAGPLSNPNPTIDLSGITQNWDKKLPNNSRFTILTDFDSQAVRDNETGLVWERTLAGGAGISWASASYACINKSVAGRKAWRLPSIAELLSLVDTTKTNPALPSGHPFSGIQSIYWSSTTIQDLPTFVWGIDLPTEGTITIDKSSTVSAWCVRGTMQESSYGANP